MSKKRKQPITDYDIVNQVLGDYKYNTEAFSPSRTDAFKLGTDYNKYLESIPNRAQDSMAHSGVYYDEQGNERPMSELDDSGWFDSGVAGTGKLLRKAKDLVLWDGTLASDDEKKKAIENGVNPEFAESVGKMAAQDLAERASQRVENIGSVLGFLRGIGDTELNTRLIADKLIPYYHPEKKEWVLKQVTDDDIKAGAAALSAYGTPSESDGFFKSFTRGLSNGLGKTLPMIYNAQEAVVDLSEASWNFYTGKGFNSFDKGETDKLAEKYRKGSDEGASPQSIESQDIFSVEGLASGLGQGVASLAQFGAIGGGATSLYTGFGTLTGKQGLKMLGANSINNLNKAGMFTAGMILNGGEAYESAKQAGLNEEDAATMFLAVGAINSLVEMGLGSNKLQKWLIGDKGVEQVPRIILQETGGDLSKLASKKNNILNTVMDRVNRFTEIPILGTAVEEASEEFIQTLVGATGEFLYNKIASNKGTEGNGLFESKNLSEVFKEAFGAAAIGAILGGAGGVISRNSTAEKENVLPFIINNQSDLVKSTLAEMFENQIIDEGTYQAYDERVDQLDKIWKTNKNVFSKLANLEGVDENSIKSHVLSLIDTEFELKKTRNDYVKNISEINGDSDLSDAVKIEKVKQVQSQIQDIDNQINNLSKKITSFIPNDQGQIGYFQKRESYNEVRDFIIKSANNIIPINEDEVESVFNYSNKAEQLDSILDRVNEEGLTQELKQEIKETIGLDNKDAFIDSVISIRDNITKQKEIAKQKKSAEEQKQFEAEENKVKENKKKIKEKAAKVKKTEVAEETNDESEDDFELSFKPATLLDESGQELNNEQENIEDTEIPAEISDSELIEEEIDSVLEPEIKNNTQLINYNNNDYIVDIDSGKITNSKTGREISVTSVVGKNILDSVDWDYNIETESLSTEENAVIVNIDQEEAYDNNQELKKDGLIINPNNLEKIKSDYKIIDSTRKRAVGNTLISLNINYVENVLGSTNAKSDYYSIFDSYNEDGRLDVNKNFDSRLQDPKQFKPGDSLKVIIPTYQQIVSRGIDEKNPYTEAKYNSDITNTDSIPIAFVNNEGNIIGFLPTVDNIKKRVDKKYVFNEIFKNRELREKIYENRDSDITLNITDKTTGTPMFQQNNQSIYNALGDGSRMADGVKIGIFKEGKLQVGLNNVFQENIKLPENFTREMYFEEGLSYSIIPSAIDGTYFALPMNISTIGESGANSIIKMLELYKATDKFYTDSDLLTERDRLSAEVDFTNFKEFMNAVDSITYTSNDSDNHIFKLTKDKLLLGMTEDMQFTWNQFRDKFIKDKVREILSKRFHSVKLSSFNNRFQGFELNEDGSLGIKEYNNYFDYINEKSVLTSNVQSEPIVGKTNERYFTAQSVIEVGNIQVNNNQKQEAKVKESLPSNESKLDNKEVSKKPKNRLGLKPKAKKNNTDLNEDMIDFYNPFVSIKQEAEFLMKKCSN